MQLLDDLFFVVEQTHNARRILEQACALPFQSRLFAFAHQDDVDLYAAVLKFVDRNEHGVGYLSAVHERHVALQQSSAVNANLYGGRHRVGFATVDAYNQPTIFPADRQFP